MQDNVCIEKHKRIDEKLEYHEKRLDEHDEKIDRLDRADAQKDTQIENLCRQMGSLTKAIWGLVSIVATALIGFFVWAVQTGLTRGIGGAK